MLVVSAIRMNKLFLLGWIITLEAEIGTNSKDIQKKSKRKNSSDDSSESDDDQSNNKKIKQYIFNVVFPPYHGEEQVISIVYNTIKANSLSLIAEIKKWKLKIIRLS